MGVLQRAKKVKDAVQGIKREAIVISETTNASLSAVIHGGVSADFGFMKADTKSENLLGSPVRYTLPYINIFSNGTNLNQLYQTFAAGHSLV